jgi:hypothetical protein
MANPNIVNVTAIYGNTTYLTPSGTSAVVLLPNAASSNKVFKIESIVATNSNTSTAFNATVALYTNGAQAQGSAPSGGTAYPLISTASVPANAALVVVDKSTGFYLQEGTSISVTSGSANQLTFTVSYEDIS